jgi:hypothetical protein
MCGVASPFAREKGTVRVRSAIWHVGCGPLSLVLSPSRRGEARITGPASFEIETVFDTIAQAWSSQ